MCSLLYFYFFGMKKKEVGSGWDSVAVRTMITAAVSSWASFNQGSAICPAGPGGSRASQHGERQAAETRHVRRPTNRPITPDLTAARDQSICRLSRESPPTRPRGSRYHMTISVAQGRTQAQANNAAAGLNTVSCL
jgi:hypothetical protein